MNGVILKMDKKFGQMESEIGEIRQTLSHLSSERRPVQSSQQPTHSSGQGELVTTVRELKAGQVKLMHDVTENLAKTSSNLDEIRDIKNRMTSFIDNMKNEGERVKKSSAETSRSLSEKCEKISQSQVKLAADVMQRIDKLDDVIKSGKLVENHKLLTVIQSEVSKLPTKEHIVNRKELKRKLKEQTEKLDKIPDVDQVMLKQELAENFQKVGLATGAEGGKTEKGNICKLFLK